MRAGELRGAIDRPVAQWHDETCLLGDRNELVRLERGAGATPANERFGIHGSCVAEPDDGLQRQGELVARDCSSKVGFELEPRSRRLAHLDFEQLDATTALGLGATECQAGVTQDGVGSGRRVPLSDSDAD